MTVILKYFEMARKFLSSFTALLCIACVLTIGQPLSVNAEIYGKEITYGYLTYQTVDENEDGMFDYIQITGCDKLITEVEIPSEINGVPVTTIRYGAFFSCSIKSITIPNTITSIGDDAFFRCENLSNVKLGNNVLSIGDNAFACCKNISNINIPDCVVSIGKNAFYSCSLTDITLPDSVASIGREAFSNCENLLNINVAKNNMNYSSIDGILFNKEHTELILYPCSKSNVKYVIPNSVTSIANDAFYNCTNLESIVIPKNVHKIGDTAFGSCDNLLSITIENSSCIIYDSTYTIYTGMNGNGFYFNGTIYGYENSTAESYAKKYKKNFAVIDSESEFILGDANGDGHLRASDAAFIAKALAEASINGKKITVEDYPAADFNQDGKLTAADAAAIAKYLAELSIKK